MTNISMNVRVVSWGIDPEGLLVPAGFVVAAVVALSIYLLARKRRLE